MASVMGNTQGLSRGLGYLMMFGLSSSTHVRQRVVAAAVAIGLVLSAFALIPARAAANTWSSGTSMAVARAYFAAATGSDNRVYAFGGNSTTTAPVDYLATVAVQSTAGTWSTAAPMSVPRSDLAASRLLDGRIVVLGGVNGTSGIQSAVETYTPSSNSWLADTSLPAPTTDLGAATGRDGKIYAVGGFAGGTSYLNTTAVYTPAAAPASGSWTTSPSTLAVGRSSLAVTTDQQGRIWAIGGRNIGGVTGAVEMFDPANPGLGWVTKASLLTARADLGAATGPDGIIYAIGGVNGAGAAVNTVEAIDPALGGATWSTKANLLSSRGGLAVTLGPD
ncbi:MAG: hypothetical protein QOG64_747, partial [Acidimicrobiaceae bacterium]|nr:hypothetical protein [Acidimicrobiaceae bacterium]